MIYVRCEVREHPESGITGLVPSRYLDWFYKYEAYIPSSALGHDVISHGYYENGTFENELQALGCETWLSDMYTRYSSMYSPENILANDISSSLEDAHRVDWCFPKLEKVKKVRNSFFRFDEVEDLVSEALEILKKSHCRNAGIESYSEAKDFILWIRENSQAIIEHIAYGYWYAGNVRYKGRDSWNIFQLKKKIDELTPKDVEPGTYYNLAYNLKGFVKFTKHYY